MTPVPPPPALARRIMALALPADAREYIVHELEEVYRRICRQEGSARARRWYWREALAFSGGFAVEQLRERATGRHPITVSNQDKRGFMRTFIENWTGDFKHAARSLARVKKS